MKGKIISVLFCLMLVFGLLVSCDNGALKEQPYKNDGEYEANVAVDWYLRLAQAGSLFYVDKQGVEPEGPDTKPDGIPDGQDPTKPLSKTNLPKTESSVTIINHIKRLGVPETALTSAKILKGYIPYFPIVFKED